MPKVLPAPYGYECAFQEACPHLQGLSTQWMWLRHQEDLQQAQADRQRIEQLVRECQQKDGWIVQLEKENAELKAKLHALHQKQFKGKVPKDASTGTDASTGATQKKRGAPVGHPPWNRRAPDHVDQTVAVPAPEQCPHCQSPDLQAWAERSQHLQEDIVLCPQTLVVCFDHAQAWCPQCRRAVMQAAPGELIGSYIGPVAKSTSAYLHLGIGLSCRNVRKILVQLFGLPLVPASVLGFEQAACAKAEGLYADLHEKIQASAYLHADETSWRVDGENYWLWYVGHEELAYFHIDRHRSGEVAQKVIGPNFTGILNTDDYAAYNGAPARGRQSCLAHPLRLAREALQTLAVLEPKTQVDGPARRFVEKAKEMLVAACETGRQLRAEGVSPAQADRLQGQYAGRLKRLCAKELNWEPAEQLRCRLWKQRKNLFTFVHHPAVQPTNNQAEQSLRRSVIMRKLTFGNRSEAGARRQAMLTSLVMTAQRQGRDPRSALEGLWTQPQSVAQKAFYRVKSALQSVVAKARAGVRKSKKHPPSRDGKGQHPP